MRQIWASEVIPAGSSVSNSAILYFRGGWPEVMRKATLPKVERVDRLEGQVVDGFLDVMMGEVFSPWHFYIQVRHGADNFVTCESYG